MGLGAEIWVRHTLFKHATVLFPERCISFAVLLLDAGQTVEHLLRDPFSNGCNATVILENFTADVQRQVRRVDYPLHESKPIRQKLVCILFDQYSVYVEVKSIFLISVEEVERGSVGNEEKGLVFKSTLCFEGNFFERRLPIMGDVFVELCVLFFRNVRWVTCPDGFILLTVCHSIVVFSSAPSTGLPSSSRSTSVRVTWSSMGYCTKSEYFLTVRRSTCSWVKSSKAFSGSASRRVSVMVVPGITFGIGDFELPVAC